MWRSFDFVAIFWSLMAIKDQKIATKEDSLVSKDSLTSKPTAIITFEQPLRVIELMDRIPEVVPVIYVQPYSFLYISHFFLTPN